MKTTTRILAAILVLAMVMSVAGCSSNKGTESTPPSAGSPDTSGEESSDGKTGSDTTGNGHADTVTIVMQSPCETLNPYNITGNYGDPLYDCIYEKLFEYTYDGQVLPRLCTTYDTRFDDEGHMILTFHLDPDATWEDGTPLTAHDIVFTAQLITNGDVTATRRYYWSSLVGTDGSGICEDVSKLAIVALDDHTVEYTLKESRALDAYFIIEARFQYILPKHKLENVEPAKMHQDEFFLHPLGAGPVLFDSMTEGQRYELVANENYYRGRTNFDRLVLLVMDPANYAAAFSSGEIDANTSQGLIQLDDWEYISSLNNVTAESVESYAYQWMNINQSRDYFKDPKVRKAISMAINRQAMVDQLMAGQGRIAVSSITPNSQYFNPAIKNDPFDPEGARSLLEEAGWDFDRELDFAVPTGNKVRENSAVLIQQDLQAVGIKTKIRLIDFANEVKELREGTCDLGLLGASSPDPDDVRVNFNLEGANNFSHLDNWEFYELLDKARSVTTVEERRELYFQWQALCDELTPIVWLYHQNSLFAYNNKFVNYPCEDFLAVNMRVMEWTFK